LHEKYSYHVTCNATQQDLKFVVKNKIILIGSFLQSPMAGCNRITPIGQAAQETALEVLPWWAGPTRSDEPVTQVLKQSVQQFSKEEDNHDI